MRTKNSEHLEWLHDRMINVYNERPNVDFLNRFREIIDETKANEKGLNLDTLKHIKNMFSLQSDLTTKTNGYQYLLETIKDLEGKK